MDHLQHRFAIELCRREVHACNNLEAMRQLTLKTLALLESQREVFSELLKRDLG